MQQSLFTIVASLKSKWIKENQNLNKTCLCMVLIAAGRSVLLVFQQNVVTFVDSHLHKHVGSLIVQCPEYRLECFCTWISFELFQGIYKIKPSCFEISIIDEVK